MTAVPRRTWRKIVFGLPLISAGLVLNGFVAADTEASANTLIKVTSQDDRATASPSNTLDNGTLDGWNDYKFGMLLNEVRHTQPVQWGAYDMFRSPGLRGQPPTVTRVLNSLHRTTAFNADFQVSAFFDDSEKLKFLSLTHTAIGNSAPSCETDYQAIIRSLERQYGPFSSPPLPGTASEETVVPSAISTYRITKTAEGILTDGYQSHSAYSQRAIGTRHISAKMSFLENPKDPNVMNDCHVTIMFL